MLSSKDRRPLFDMRDDSSSSCLCRCFLIQEEKDISRFLERSVAVTSAMATAQRAEPDRCRPSPIIFALIKLCIHHKTGAHPYLILCFVAVSHTARGSPLPAGTAAKGRTRNGTSCVGVNTKLHDDNKRREFLILLVNTEYSEVGEDKRRDNSSSWVASSFEVSTELSLRMREYSVRETLRTLDNGNTFRYSS